MFSLSRRVCYNAHSEGSENVILFISDYDGTLHINEEVDQETLDAIDRFRAQGNLFAIATGRSINSIQHQIDEYQIPVDFIIGDNGAIAMDENQNEIYRHWMDFETVSAIIDLIPTDQLLYYGVSDGIKVGLHDEDNNRLGNDATFVPINDVMMHEKSIGLFVKLDSEVHALEFASLLNDRFKDEIRAYTWRQYVDILNCGVTKNSGIIEYKEAKNLDFETYVIGDSFNDIPMIRGFNGFAICSGDQAAIDAASICFDNVGKAIKYVMAKQK